MLKRNSTLVFLICIFLSSLFWVFDSLSKKTERSVVKEINIINIPNNLILDSLSNKIIKINLEGYGFSMIKLFFEEKKININYEEIEKNLLHLDEQKISKFIPTELKIKNINPNQIFCSFSKLKTKKIPINIDNININCKSPYKIYGNIRVEPDSILISGSLKELNKINEWKVQPMSFTNIDNNINEILYLEKSNLIIGDNKIYLQADVDKFTESEIMVPINIINQSEENVKLATQEVKIKYLIAVKNYNKVTVNDFNIICDWKEIDPNKRTIKIKDVKGPEYVEIININNIKKKEFRIWIDNDEN